MIGAGTGDPLAALRPDLDFLSSVCAGLSLRDPVAEVLDPVAEDWARLESTADQWRRVAGAIEPVGEDLARTGPTSVERSQGPSAAAGRPGRAAREVGRSLAGAAAALREAADLAEATAGDAADAVLRAGELLADVGRTTSHLLALPALGGDAARRMIEHATEQVVAVVSATEDAVEAMAQRWATLTDELAADPLVAVVPTPGPPASDGSVPDGSSAGTTTVDSAGGVRVAVHTDAGSSATVSVSALPDSAPPAGPAAPVQPAAAAEGAPTGSAGGGAAVPTGGAGGGGGVPSGGGAGGGAGVGGAAAPAAALNGGVQTAAVDPGTAKPAAPAAATPLSGGGQASGGGRGGMAGGMMPMMGGAKPGGGDQERQTRSRYVADAEELVGPQAKTAPPVIGEQGR